MDTLVALLPALIVWGGFVVGIVFLVRYVIRKRKADTHELPSPVLVRGPATDSDVNPEMTPMTTESPAPSPPRRVSDEERKRLLAEQIRTEITRGYRLDSQGQFDATVAKGQPINHTAHLIATLATCGIWGLVWLVITLTGGVKRSMVMVDEYGNVMVQDISTK